MKNTFLQKFLRDESGSNLIEFAIVAPVFFLIFIAIIEYGMFTYHRIIIQSIMTQASREASLGKTSGGACSGTDSTVNFLKCLVAQKANGLVQADRVQVTANRLTDGGVMQPDICILQNGDISVTQATCESPNIIEEVNGIAGYQSFAQGGNTGAGGELVEVRVVYPWRTMVPWFQPFLGQISNGTRTGIMLISASSVVKNEPF